jgi:type III secretion protein L
MSKADPFSADVTPADGLAELNRTPPGAILRAGDLHPWSDGERYLAAAKQVLDQARQRADHVAAAERARGYQEGWDAGSKELFDFLAQTKLAVDAYYAQLETNLRELAIQLLQEIVGELDASDAVASAVRKALNTLSLGDQVTLYIAPEVLSAVREKLEGQLSHSAASAIILRADPKLSPAGCVLASEYCTVDLSLDKQLSLLAGSLRASNIGVRE